MKIGIFTDTYCPEINGVATSVEQLRRGLEADGNEVYIFAPKNRGRFYNEKNVIRERSVSCPLVKDRRICCFNMGRALKKVDTLKLDIIHCQTEFEMGQLAMKSARLYNIPLIHTYHTVYEDYTHYLKFPGCNSKLTKSAIRKLSKHICNKADMVIVPTDKVKRLLLEYGVKKEIVIQPTGISFDKFKNVNWERVKELKKKYNIKSNNKVLITVGRLAKEKNIGELIEYLPNILEKQKDTLLIIVGDGPIKEHLEKKAKRLGISDRVIFTGSASWEEIENYYALGDIFVGASTSETQGITYIEALAGGKPLLVRRDDCLKNVLIEGETGLGYDNEKEFVKGYFEICKNYENMSEICFSKATDYSEIGFAKNVENVYKRCLKKYR